MFVCPVAFGHVYHSNRKPKEKLGPGDTRTPCRDQHRQVSDHQVNTHLKRQGDSLNASPEQRAMGHNLSVPRITPTAHKKYTACVRDQENT